MTDMTISNTILTQLGGNRFLAMTGAKNLTTSGKDLNFKIMRNSEKITHVIIRLNDKDLYDIDFLNIRMTKTDIRRTIKNVAFDVYAEDLQRVFTAHTGLDTHL